LAKCVSARLSFTFEAKHLTINLGFFCHITQPSAGNRFLFFSYWDSFAHTFRKQRSFFDEVLTLNVRFWGALKVRFQCVFVDKKEDLFLHAAFAHEAAFTQSLHMRFASF